MGLLHPGNFINKIGSLFISQYLKQADMQSIIIFVVLLVAIIIFLAIGSRASKKRSAYSGKASKKKYSRWVFHRLARNAGLSSNLIRTLDNLIKAYKVREPFLIFSNNRLLDTLLNRAIYSINNDVKMTPDEKTNKTAPLFQIKQIIDNSTKKSLGISSSHLLRTGQSILFVFPDNVQIRSKVVRNTKKYLSCLLPYSTPNANSRWKKSTKMKALFWRHNDSGYMFITKILGFGRNEEERTVEIAHSTSLKRNQQRKAKRRVLNRKCFYYPIEVFQFSKGRKPKKKAVVQYNLRHLGSVVDICAGGCSINTKNPLERGRYLKMEFKVNTPEELQIYGRVRRTSKTEDNHHLMHIIFTNISRNNRNQIYSYVYNYT
jgi:c-di-GMP-binding flagellar brake protein YcgR